MCNEYESQSEKRGFIQKLVNQIPKLAKHSSCLDPLLRLLLCCSSDSYPQFFPSLPPANKLVSETPISGRFLLERTNSIGRFGNGSGRLDPVASGELLIAIWNAVIPIDASNRLVGASIWILPNL